MGRNMELEGMSVLTDSRMKVNSKMIYLMVQSNFRKAKSLTKAKCANVSNMEKEY
jgi:hypothetical protein